jgi:glutaredoxin
LNNANHMNRPDLRWLLATALAGCAFALSAQTMYRYVDPTGRVVYSDQPPPPAAKGVETKQLQQNIIETDPVSFAAKEATEKYPVTLYTFDCEVCKQAEALLAKRGVPFTTVIVSDEDGAAKLKALTGKQSAPVLQVGEKQVITGFNASRWQTVLDDAGYPKTAPPARQASKAQPGNANATAPGTAGAAPADAASPTPPARGTDYPK